MKLYLVIDYETDEIVKGFTSFEALQEFAKTNQYAYDYYEVDTYEFTDYELFLDKKNYK